MRRSIIVAVLAVAALSGVANADDHHATVHVNPADDPRKK